MTTILIFSKDGVAWQRYNELEWETYKEAEQDHQRIDNEIKTNPEHGSYFYELVGREFFETFNTPYS